MGTTLVANHEAGVDKQARAISAKKYLGRSEELIICPECGRPTYTLVFLINNEQVFMCSHCEKPKLECEWKHN